MLAKNGEVEMTIESYFNKLLKAYAAWTLMIMLFT